MTSATRPTLVTVAKLAGVSLASASRALNGGNASPDVQRRVLAAAEQLGYVPDAAARSLRERRTRQLTFAVADIGNPFYVTMMSGIESLTRAEGYRLLVHATGGDPADEVSLIESMSRRYVDGMIISPLRVTDELAPRPGAIGFSDRCGHQPPGGLAGRQCPHGQRVRRRTGCQALAGVRTAPTRDGQRAS